MNAGRISLAAVLIAAAIAILPAYGAPVQTGTVAPVIGAKSAVLVDAASGAVLLELHAHDRLPVASTTKILTAVLALESAKPDSVAVVSERASKTESSSLGLKPGERITVDTLLTALLLKSANDAAVVIAEHVGGSVEGFAAMMNAKARELGATDSHFVNPNGLHDPNHYSSAYDLALFAREGMQLPRFRELVRTKTADIARPDLGTVVPLTNHNKLLWRDDTVDGVKTGFVKESGHCLVASATRQGWQLIAVVLDSPDPYTESEALLDWGFRSFHQSVLAQPGNALGQAPVAYGEKSTVTAVCEFPLSAVVGPGLSQDAHVAVKLSRLQAPVKQGQTVGKAQLVVGGKVVQTSALVAREAVPRSRVRVALGWGLRALGMLLIAALAVRTTARGLRTYRRRRRSVAAQGRRPGPR